MCFRPAMKALHRNHDQDVLAELGERFSGRILTPAFRPGDAMMMSNWTLHQSHATPATLQDILQEHGIACGHDV